MCNAKKSKSRKNAYDWSIEKLEMPCRDGPKSLRRWKIDGSHFISCSNTKGWDEARWIHMDEVGLVWRSNQ